MLFASVCVMGGGQCVQVMGESQERCRGIDCVFVICVVSTVVFFFPVLLYCFPIMSILSLLDEISLMHYIDITTPGQLPTTGTWYYPAAGRT